MSPDDKFKKAKISAAKFQQEDLVVNMNAIIYKHMLTLKSRCLPVMGGGVLVSRT